MSFGTYNKDESSIVREKSFTFNLAIAFKGARNWSGESKSSQVSMLSPEKPVTHLQNGARSSGGGHAMATENKNKMKVPSFSENRNIKQ